MLVIGDALDAFYFGAFLFGLLFSALSLVAGAGHVGTHWLHHGSDGFHLGGHGSHHGHGGQTARPLGGHHGSGDQSAVGPLNLSSLLAFLAWFGGIGLLGRYPLGLGTWGSVAGGIVGGLIAGFAIYLFLERVVLPSDGALDPADFRLPGTLARVCSPIRVGGTGEVVYEQGGTRQVAAARATDGKAVARGTEVVILATERGIVRVEPWSTFVGDRHPDLVPFDGSDVYDRDQTWSDDAPVTGPGSRSGSESGTIPSQSRSNARIAARRPTGIE